MRSLLLFAFVSFAIFQSFTLQGQRNFGFNAQDVELDLEQNEESESHDSDLNFIIGTANDLLNTGELDGVIGVDGQTGPNGNTGPDGDDGSNGSDGIDGQTAPQGNTGSSDSDASDGNYGEDGQTGPQGNTGSQGDSDAITEESSSEDDAEIASILQTKEVATTQRKISVFPIPTDSQLNLQFESSNEEQVEFQVFDMSGNLIHFETRTLSLGINLHQLNLRDNISGQYILNVIRSTSVETIPILIN